MKIKTSITFLNQNKVINLNQVRQWIPITLILLLAAMLYFYQLGTESLWIDEIFSIRDAQKNIFNLGLNRPLYFIFLHFWMRFGSSEAWLRGLSVIFGLVSVWLIYQLGVRLSNRATGLVAALLLTLSPLVINHTQEVRMYVLSMCLGLGGTLVLTDVLDQFTISSLAKCLILRFMAILTTPINILLFLPDLVLLGIKFRHKKKYLFKIAKKWRWLIIAFTVLLLLSLIDIVPPLLDFLGDRQQVIAPPGFPAFVGALTRFTVWPLKSPFAGLESIYEKFFNIYAVILLGLLGLSLYTTKKSGSVKLWWSAAWSFLPLTVLFIFCQTYSGLWGVNRYLLFTAPYILILLAAGWLRLWQWQRAMAIIVMMLYFFAVGGALFNYYTVQNRQDWRGVAQVIEFNERSGDQIAVFSESNMPAVEYYYRGTAPIQAIKIPKKFEESQLKQALVRLSSAHSRFWLVCRFYNFSIYSQQKELFKTVLEKKFYIEKHQKFAGDLELFLISDRHSSSKSRNN
ncbi:MAG: glycosyltransferase family 39 protein [Pleurocapsa sp. MO_226.B13]|nr:glycosyltransferase family 39 protein [Pleurocapsa sp. MO_226.B13]